jgi:hypothetical protein
MSPELFTSEDVRQIKAEGFSEAEVREQIELFQRGFPSIILNRPCTVDDGIIVIPAGDQDGFVQQHERECRKNRMLKFVPASGAASRMFKEWFEFLGRETFSSEKTGEEFIQDLRRFAFFDDLHEAVKRRGGSLDDWMSEKRYGRILSCILTEEGLNYGNLPKALLKFHAYPNGSRAAIEEHLVEAALYARGGDGVCRVHFTLSGEHEEIVRQHLSSIRHHYERRYGVSFDISLSVQSPSTNAIAVDLENRPFRDEKGRLVFRPGGHGSLLVNINGLKDGDIVFLKNIDNIVPDRLKPVTAHFKKVLSGYLISLQEEIFGWLKRMSEGTLTEEEFETIIRFCREKLYINLQPGFDDLPAVERQRLVFSRLNRPVRVCGMVRNEGEPGGGPFWVDEADSTQSIQIIEESQIDPHSASQRAIWSTATHFNPVDLVCGIRDYRRRKFDLAQFVNRKTFSISRKSEKGMALRALERPGLWNGSMHNWTTLFVEVPIETFNPVKTVYDLLRPQHLSGR